MAIYRKLIISFIVVTFGTSSYAVGIDKSKDPVYKSWQYYKKASSEYNNGNYETALDYVQKSLSFKQNKKNKKLEQQIAEQGYRSLETGTALIYFNPTLAKQHLTKAKNLINPKDKNTLAKIEGSLKSLEAVQ